MLLATRREKASETSLYPRRDTFGITIKHRGTETWGAIDMSIAPHVSIPLCLQTAIREPMVLSQQSSLPTLLA